MPSLCPSREEFDRLLNGLLHDAEEQRLEAHVKSCAGCRAVLEELTVVVPKALSASGLRVHLPRTQSTVAAPTDDTLDAHGPATELLERLQQGVRRDTGHSWWHGPGSASQRGEKTKRAED